MTAVIEQVGLAEGMLSVMLLIGQEKLQLGEVSVYQ